MGEEDRRKKKIKVTGGKDRSGRGERNKIREER